LQAFISYSFQDNAIKDKLKKTLQFNDIKCYDAAHDEDYGSFLPDKLSRAIDSSNFLIAILTHSGSSSTSVSGEIAYAKRAGKRIIPLVEEGASVPIFLQGTEQIKFNSNTLDDACQKIVKFIGKKLSEPNQEEIEGHDRIEETIVIENGEYQTYSYDLDENETLIGQIVSDMPVNIFIFNDRNLAFLHDDKMFVPDYQATKILRCKINFHPPGAGTWNVVILLEENDDDEPEEADVDVFLHVK